MFLRPVIDVYELTESLELLRFNSRVFLVTFFTILLLSVPVAEKKKSVVFFSYVLIRFAS